MVIVGVDGWVVRDNFNELLPGTAAPDLEGHREAVFDLTLGQPVGHIYVDVNREYLSNESHGFLNTLLYITAIGGMLTIAVAVVLAAWMSKRITAPVTALTEATQAIAQGGMTRLSVTSSDELGRMSAAFNRMASALATQRELRSRLINDVSHELNTPLSVIKLEARGLRDGLQTPENASHNIIQEVDRLSGIVTDLDWLAETDSGELALTLEAGSIQELLTAEVDRWQPQAQARQVELSSQISRDLPDLDLNRLRDEPGSGKRHQQRHSLHRGGRGVWCSRQRWRATRSWLSPSPMTGSVLTPQTFPTSLTASTERSSLAVVGLVAQVWDWP